MSIVPKRAMADGQGELPLADFVAVGDETDFALNCGHEGSAYSGEIAARVLEASGDYRVLRRVKPRNVIPYQPAVGDLIGVVIDVETTGLDFRQDQVIELGAVAFVYDRHGHVGPVIGTLNMLREPTVEISAAITKLTGITSEMVAGQALDVDAVRSLITRADLLIAHNARFDRPFCEAIDGVFAQKAWACTVTEVRWSDGGYEGAKLGHLLMQSGRFHRGHRAIDDCHALVELLASPMPNQGRPALKELVDSAQRVRIRIWAEKAPFELKDILKARGYRWNSGQDGNPKSWWVEVDEAAAYTEMNFLSRNVYGHGVDLRRDRLTAHVRYRSP